MFILTVRNDGLGDLILTLPTLAALHRVQPEARLGVVVRPDCAALFELVPLQVDVWSDGSAARVRLKRERPDAVLFLRPDPAWARASFFSRVRRRIGTRHRWQSLFFNERVPVRRRDSGRHEAESNALVAAPLGVTLPVPSVRLVVPPARQKQAEVVSGDSQDRYIVVHPGSAGSSPNWPVSHYAQLVERLSRSGWRVLVTCGPLELELAKAVAGVHGQVISPTELARFAAVLAKAAAVVSGSTGPMHLAAALGTRVVALFSARAPHSKERWGPWGADAVVIESAPVRTSAGVADLSNLSPDDVILAVQESAEARRIAP